MSAVNQGRIGIIMNGVTGRMGTNQHLLRSIIPIIQQGGVHLGPEEVVVPDPILVGRNEEKLKALVALSGIEKWSTNPADVLQDPDYQIYFDAQTTNRRVEFVQKAIDAGKHVYCEKPIAENGEDAVKLYREVLRWEPGHLEATERLKQLGAR